MVSVVSAADGPIGWWKLDETSGSIAADSSGNGNSGNIDAGVTLGISGEFGTAYSFNNFFDNSRVVVPYGSGTLAPATTHITVSAWINPTNLGGQHGVLSNEGIPGDGTYGYGLRVINYFGRTLQWCWATEGGPGDCAYALNSIPDPALNVWTHVAATYDGSVLREYVNGVNVHEAPSTQPPLNTTRDLVIGNLPSGGLPWFGGIDDVRVYARTLCDSEIAALAHGLEPHPADCPGSDTTPPVIQSLTPSPGSLWPPNHKMVNVTVGVNVTDNNGPCPSCACTIVAATSSEPDNGLGDGDTSGDIGTPTGLGISLRAERGGKGPGRVYKLTVTCKDVAGNSSAPMTTTVTVPKSQGK